MKTFSGLLLLCCLYANGVIVQTPEVAKQIKNIHYELHDHLYNELIPFWNRNAVDKECGGFVTNFDASGKPIEMPEKYLNTQCRMIWWFSQLNLDMPNETYQHCAEQGVDFLIQYFWDEKNEGWKWKVEQYGSEVDNGKIVYGQSFAIYSLADYYISTGDIRGLEYAEMTFDLLQKHCADARNGGIL
jgi:mannobiose 2-epimerase